MRWSPLRFIEVQVGVAAETALVVVQDAHALIWFQTIAFDSSVYLSFDQPNQLVLAPLRHGANADHRATLDGFFDVPAAFFVFVKEDVNLVDSPKQIMQVPHDILVGTQQKETEIVRLKIGYAVQRQSLFDVLQVNKLAHLTV